MCVQVSKKGAVPSLWYWCTGALFLKTVFKNQFLLPHFLCVKVSANQINLSLSFLLRVTAKMRLYLAVAVLMLAFVAYTGRSCVNYTVKTSPQSSFLPCCVTLCPSLSPAEAQEETIEQRFTKFGEQMSEMSKTLAEKAKNTFEQIQTSEIAVNTK